VVPLRKGERSRMATRAAELLYIFPQKLVYGDEDGDESTLLSIRSRVTYSLHAFYHNVICSWPRSGLICFQEMLSHQEQCWLPREQRPKSLLALVPSACPFSVSAFRKIGSSCLTDNYNWVLKNSPAAGHATRARDS
jgi:hypothetical protein